MRNSKEKSPKEGISPSMALLVLAVTGTVTMMTTTTTTSNVAFAQACVDDMQPCHGTPPQTPGAGPDPSCWGEATSGVAKSSGGVGEHSSDPIQDEDDESHTGKIDRETPRSGIGNMEEDTPGEHGEAVDQAFGQDCTAR
jgi:hypothetical protein